MRRSRRLVRAHAAYPRAVRTVDVSRELATSPAAAWDVLVDTRRWPAWGPSVRAVACDPPVLERVGQAGRLRGPLGPWVPFEVTELEPGRRWGWRVAGVPATGHRVEPTAAGCRVVFEVPLVALPYAAVCRVALARIADLVEGPGR